MNDKLQAKLAKANALCAEIEAQIEEEEAKRQALWQAYHRAHLQAVGLELEIAQQQKEAGNAKA